MPKLNELLGIKFPIIMAPMFLVSNTKMVIEALNSGITAAIPALNYRSTQELSDAIDSIKAITPVAFGINLIVNKSNAKQYDQLAVCLEKKIGFVITSLGNPKHVIDACKPLGIKVFCDVVDLKYALKVEQLGADAVIAVNNKAGGHAGSLTEKDVIFQLKSKLKIPVISAGGVATGEQVEQTLSLGADGLSIGTVFIATKESPVSEQYKQALINYGAKDIVMTDKISGSNLTVINTPYVHKIGTKASSIERFLFKNKWLKKYYKLYKFFIGMKKVQNSAFKATYNTVWCAGPSIEYVKEVKSVKNVVKELVRNL